MIIYQAHEISGRLTQRRYWKGDEREAERVHSIVREVREEGDQALDRISQELDGQAVTEIPRDAWREAFESIEEELRAGMALAKDRIEAFYRNEPAGGFRHGDQGDVLAQIIRPLERVGVYVPGGSAPLLSTLLMCVVPARVAGVGEVVVASPPPVHPAILAAAHIAGADQLFAMGGAQAVAALAYGTSRVPKVDKVVGPGNRFVILAKREVYGAVGLEGLPGPTETLIIADEGANPVWLAADMLAQAEHGADSEAWLLSPSIELLRQVKKEIERQIEGLPRARTARSALANGGLVQVSDLSQALDLANAYAPEHLCLSLKNPQDWLDKVKNAGGVFLGEYSGEALGDYLAGPSHVMPTSGSARFGAGLAVRDFLKVIPVVGLSKESASKLAPAGARMAREEGLEAHARALDLRAGSES